MKTNNFNEFDRLFVYIDPPTYAKDTKPQLLQIAKNEDVVLRQYEEVNSASGEMLSMVIDDMLKLSPSLEYGLILWSHGTSWLPPSNTNQLKSFGRDGYFEMDIRDLAAAIPSGIFEYIIFDACLMGSVEVVYQLRNITPYILASPTEVLANGFPYHEVIEILFDDKIENTKKRLQAVAEQYMSFYNTQSGSYKSASVSLINTHYLESLASATSTLLHSNSQAHWGFNIENVQKLDVYYNTITFDYLDFLYKNYPDNLVRDIEIQLNKVVEYRDHTTEFIGLFRITNFSGLSCYIPQMDQLVLNKYYQTLDWSKDSRFYLMFDD